MRPPNGACSTSCMPPASSKKRSATTRRSVGTRAERGDASRDVRDELRRAAGVDAALARRASAPRAGIAGRAATSSRRSRHRGRQLARARRRLAEPERDRRRRAVRVLDAHPARLDAPDAPRVVAEQEDVAAHALDREVLVDRADAARPCGSSTDVVVGGVGDRAAAGDGGEPRAAARRARGRARDRGGGAPSAARAASRRPRRASRARRRSRARVRSRIRIGAAHEREAAPRRRSRRPRRSRRICCARMSSGLAGTRERVELAGADRADGGRACTSSSRVSGKTMPFGTAPSAWPERPTRWSSVASARGAPMWHTRSTVPTSMPSSSDAVATTTGTSPALSLSSASSRDARATCCRGARRRGPRRAAPRARARRARPAGAC